MKHRIRDPATLEELQHMEGWGRFCCFSRSTRVLIRIEFPFFLEADVRSPRKLRIRFTLWQMIL